MRIDKFLKNARIIKRRSVAKEACDGGRIQLNGRVAKAGSEVKEGDEIKVSFGTREVCVRVKEVIESPRKEDAENMYEVL